MFIYVSGPYTASDALPDDRAVAVDRNVATANAVALALARKGHTPFVPHTMMYGWEDQHGLPREIAMRVCLQWVGRCDAIYAIASSPGADAELAEARRHGLDVFSDLAAVPDGPDDRAKRRSAE